MACGKEIKFIFKLKTSWLRLGFRVHVWCHATIHTYLCCIHVLYSLRVAHAEDYGPSWGLFVFRQVLWSGYSYYRSLSSLYILLFHLLVIICQNFDFGQQKYKSENLCVLCNVGAHNLILTWPPFLLLCVGVLRFAVLLIRERLFSRGNFQCKWPLANDPRWRRKKKVCDL